MAVYSKYLTTKKPKASKIVNPKYILNLPKSFSLSDAQLITIVTLEVIRNIVFKVAIGTFKISDPTGQDSAPVLRKT